MFLSYFSKINYPTLNILWTLFTTHTNSLTTPICWHRWYYGYVHCLVVNIPKIQRCFYTDFWFFLCFFSFTFQSRKNINKIGESCSKRLPPEDQLCLYIYRDISTLNIVDYQVKRRYLYDSTLSKNRKTYFKHKVRHHQVKTVRWFENCSKDFS